MGRPLYSSILLSRQAIGSSTTQPDPSKTNSELPKMESPAVVKWSRTNAFDPDSDEFFNENNVVFEAFLSEDDLAEQAMAEQEQRTRTLERLLRERVADARGTVLHNEEDDRTNAGAETNHQRPSDLDVYFVDGLVREVSHSGLPRTESPLIREGEPVPNVVAPGASARDHDIAASSRLYPVDLVSDLRDLSESPGPLDPVDLPTRSVFPIPDTPARISGIFPESPLPRRRAFAVAPGSGQSPASRLMSWESPARLERVVPSVSHNADARLASIPAPLIS